MPDFPQTTGLIDNFNRADEGPPPTGWTEGYSADHGSVAGWKLSGNKAVANNPASELLEYCYWNARQYSGDVEVYLDVVQAYTGGSNIEIGIHVTNPTSATHSGYNVVLDATGGVLYRLRCYRVDNGVDTQLGSTISRLGFTPLRFGVRRTGSTIDVYTDEGSGWVLRGSFTDATYNSGYIEIGLGGQHQVDNIYAAAINLDASASVQLASLITNAQAAIETSPQLVAQLAQANLSATAILSPGPTATLEAILGNATLTAQAGIETWTTATPQLAALSLNSQALLDVSASSPIQLASLITDAQAAIETSPQLVAQLAQANLSATVILSPGPIAALEATLGNATLTAQAGIETWISATPQLAALPLNSQALLDVSASSPVQLASLITNAQAVIESSPQLIAQLAQANLSATVILSPGPIAALEATLGNATLTAQAGIETWISATPQLAALLLNAQGSPTLASGADGYRSIRILTDASLVRFSGNEMRAAGKNRVFVTTETNHAQ